MAEILLQGADRTHVEKAIDTTRRMRGALFWNDSNTEYSNAYPNTDQQQEALHDAEVLTSLTAQFLVALLSSLSQQEHRDNIETTTATYATKYAGYEPYAYAGTGTDLVATTLGNTAVLLARNWKGIILSDFYRKNAITLPNCQILSSSLGIIAPLSADYHKAMLTKEFIQTNVKVAVFDLKPAGVLPLGGVVVLPLDATGQPVFQDKKNLASYIDCISDGFTSKTLYREISTVYKGKTIFSAVK